MSQSRQLAAIMFTDIVGYTALMGEDELAAFELLKKNRTIQRPIIEKFNGKWLKEIGDGVLASFSTVSDAVYCAKEIQETCLAESDLKLRIGIHQGEVVFEENDVFGDGVNIASRLEPLAPIGGILVSESVHRNLGNKRGIETSFYKEVQLKNVKEPLKIYSVQVDTAEVGVLPKSSAKSEYASQKPIRRKLGFASLIIILAIVAYLIYYRQSPHETQITQSEIIDKSIVVLPFLNDSPDPDNEYFCNGIFDEIITQLQNIQTLNVKSRTSAEQYRNPNQDIRDIAKELDVVFVVEGSVRKAGDDLRITVQLIDAETGDHLWADTYDGKYTTEIFDFQSDIANQVAASLNAVITPDEQKRIDTPPTENLKAYELFLKAREHQWNWGIYHEIEDFNKAVSLYQQAEREDPSFALAISERASFYYHNLDHPQLEVAIDSVQILAERAIAIDPYLDNAYQSRAAYYDRVGNSDRALIDRQKAFELNPNNPVNTSILGQEYFRDGNYIYGLQLIHKAHRMNKGDEKGNFWDLHMLGVLYMELYDTENAMNYWSQMETIIKDDLGISTIAWLKVLLKDWDLAYELMVKREADSVLFARYHTMKLEPRQALNYFQEYSPELDLNNRWTLEEQFHYGVALCLNDEEERGKQILDEVLAAQINNLTVHYVDKEIRLAAINAFLGRKREAYSWLYKSEWRGCSLYDVQQDLWFGSINQEEEFKKIVKEVHEEKRKVREDIARLQAAGEWALRSLLSIARLNKARSLTRPVISNLIRMAYISFSFRGSF